MHLHKITPSRLVCVAIAVSMVLGCRPSPENVAQAAPAAAVAQQDRAAEAPAATAAVPTDTRQRARWEATANIVSASVMRVAGAAEATPGPRLAGYLIEEGTERAVEQGVLDDLVTLVRSDSGFDDSIIKRCRPGRSVGFRLSRATAPADGAAGAPATDLVLDFGCNRLLIARGSNSDVHATSFEPSRGNFIALVKRALPEDTEISALH